MHAQNFLLDQCSKWQKIEQICKIFPYVCITIFSHALIIETINLRDLSSFVISSQNCYSISPSDFYRDKKSHTFD